MVSFFEYKEKQKQVKNNIGQEKMASSIANGIIRIQQQWSLSMQGLTERLSRTAKKIALLTFCLLSGSYSIYLITGRFVTQQGKSLSIGSIQLPGYSPKVPDYSISNYPLVTKAEYLKIQQFTHYIDSLSRNQQGKKVADSILKSRPSLMDSVALMEKLYQLQSSKK